MSSLDVLLALGLAFGLYMAWNIGANDLANAMGTSVGSRALTLAQAAIVAGLFEFAGAVLVGSKVTETVRKGIVDVGQLSDPTKFCLVMLSALLSAALWLQFASWKGLPVSTTHSIVGGVAGAGLAAAGVGGLHWQRLAFIAVSWMLSPIIGGLIAYVLFRVISATVLQSRRPRLNARRLTPWLAGVVIQVLFLSLLYKGLKNVKLDLRLGQALFWATALGAVGALVAFVLVRRKGQRNRTGLRFGYVETPFRWLQVMTACYVAFAHGANDVANAVGPLAGIYAAWKEGAVGDTIGVPIWILAVGGLGIVIGLATYGFRVMETVGRRITELVPSRGFTAEFAAATTVLVCTKLGLPISTTHTLVGAVVGVGMARGVAALDLRILRSIASAWVVTLPVSFALSACLYVLLHWGLA